MRITEKVINNSLTRNISSAMRRMDKQYTQLSTGKRIQLPSDDPVGLITSLRMYDSIRQNERYKTNSETAISWLEATDAALNELTSVLNRLTELAVAAANGIHTEDSRQAYEDEIRQLREHVQQIANTQHEQRYIFGGQQTKKPAYENFIYQGDSNRLVTEIGGGATIAYSYYGEEVFRDFFQQLEEFANHVDVGDYDKITQIDIDNIQQQLTHVLNIRSEIGAKVNRLEKNTSRLELLGVQYESFLSNVEDVDYTEVIMQLKMQEMVYQAALGAGARIMQTTLLNYL
ncbi:MAG TPA: flagellar hook-associated protein FlgL [Bacillota bacterium]|nr:flagellar hook-associated protein FlgL [Bacillota bacterium]